MSARPDTPCVNIKPSLYQQGIINSFLHILQLFFMLSNLLCWSIEINSNNWFIREDAANFNENCI